MFMASTYPLEVIQADRAVKADPKLKDSPDALNKLTFDPAVKSLINFPQVLAMMSEKLDWTLKLGDAFLADQKSVMDAVQRLRGKAYGQGNLKSNNEQKVTVEQARRPRPADKRRPRSLLWNRRIRASFTSPHTTRLSFTEGGLILPTHRWPTTLPDTLRVRRCFHSGLGWQWARRGVTRGAGATGAAAMWISTSIATSTSTRISTATSTRLRLTTGPAIMSTGGGRGRVGRADFNTTRRTGRGWLTATRRPTTATAGRETIRATAQSRDAYRGRADAGRQDISRGGASDFRGGGSLDRTGASPANNARTNSQGNRAASGVHSSGFGGVDSGRSGAAAASNRGQASRSSGASSAHGRRRAAVAAERAAVVAVVADDDSIQPHKKEEVSHVFQIIRQRLSDQLPPGAGRGMFPVGPAVGDGAEGPRV